MKDNVQLSEVTRNPPLERIRENFPIEYLDTCVNSSHVITDKIAKRSPEKVTPACGAREIKFSHFTKGKSGKAFQPDCKSKNLICYERVC